jgi:hypothetical protein
MNLKEMRTIVCKRGKYFSLKIGFFLPNSNENEMKIHFTVITRKLTANIISRYTV